MEEQKALREENERLKNYIEILENQVKASECRIHEMNQSFSWKITKPVRLIKAHCTPVRFLVNFARSVKKQGFSATLQENKVKKYRKNHRYCAEILSSEFKKQRDAASEISTEYMVFIRLYEENPVMYKRMLNHIAKQSVLPKRIFVFSENISQELKSITVDGIGPIYVEKNHLNIVQESIKDENRVIYIDHYAFLTQDNIYQFEMEEGDYEILYCDDAVEYESGHYDYRYKPDYAPHYLEAENYVGNVICMKGNDFKRMMNEGLHYLDREFSFGYHILLESNLSVGHIPEILCGILEASCEQQKREERSRISYWKNKGKKDVTDAEKNGAVFLVEKGLCEGTSHIKERLDKEPLITIMIPTCDHIEDLDKCISSILQKSTYHNYEILVIENNSRQEETFAYYKQLESREKVRVITWEGSFNYSAINNYGLSFAKGEYVLLLNNDIEVIEPCWIQEMLFYARREEVGAVGAKLYFPDDTIQHAGVILGIRNLAGHGHRNYKRDADGYMHRLKVVQDYSIVTAACLMISVNKLKECGSFDEQLAVDYNDVDLCMKLRKLGYYNVFTPYAQLYHYESKSRGENRSPEQIERNGKEFFYFTTKWYQSIVKGDPFYNQHLTLEDDSFSFRQ